MKLTSIQQKNYSSRLMGGAYTLSKKVIPAYPTIDVRRATVTAKTADYTVTVANLDTPTIFNNTGAAGTIVFTLPSVRSAKGRVVRAHALAAQIIRFLPQTGEAINFNGSAVVTKYVNVAAVIGNYIELFSDGTQWIVTHSSGVVTKEA